MTFLQSFVLSKGILVLRLEVNEIVIDFISDLLNFDEQNFFGVKLN